MNEQTISPTIQTEKIKELSTQPLMTGLIAVLVIVVGLQAFQLRTLSQVIKNGSVATPQAEQGTSSLFGNLKSTVGGCGG